MIDTQTDTHTDTEADNDNTRRSMPKLASGIKTLQMESKLTRVYILRRVTSLKSFHQKRSAYIYIYIYIHTYMMFNGLTFIPTTDRCSSVMILPAVCDENYFRCKDYSNSRCDKNVQKWSLKDERYLYISTLVIMSSASCTCTYAGKRSLI